jgi:hypothetical protein
MAVAPCSFLKNFSSKILITCPFWSSPTAIMRYSVWIFLNLFVQIGTSKSGDCAEQN